jgi:hypothetical protein
VRQRPTWSPFVAVLVNSSRDKDTEIYTKKIVSCTQFDFAFRCLIEYVYKTCCRGWLLQGISYSYASQALVTPFRHAGERSPECLSAKRCSMRYISGIRAPLNDFIATYDRHVAHSTLLYSYLACFDGIAIPGLALASISHFSPREISALHNTTTAVPPRTRR